MNMAGKTFKISWLYLIVIVAFLTIGVFVWRAADNYELSNFSSLPGSQGGYKLPTIRKAIDAFDLDFYDEITDAQGASVIQGPLEMKQCCLPGSTGAKEHLLQLSFVQSSFAGVDRLKELRLSISGYCTISDATADIASAVAKAEGVLGTTSSKQELEDAIGKVLVIAHYDWMTGNGKGPQYFTVELPDHPSFTLTVDADMLEIDLAWPATLPSARNLAEVIAKYDSMAESDKLGIEAVRNANYNELALQNEEAAEEAECGSDPSSGIT